MLISILESKWKLVCPYGDSFMIIKDHDQAVSAGGVIIPDAHQEYKRRGWVVAVGGGVRCRNGQVVLPPYKPGDYLFADRAFIRPDEREDEVFGDPTIIICKVHTPDDAPWAFIRREDCVGAYAKYALPKKYEAIIEHFGFKPEA